MKRRRAREKTPGTPEPQEKKRERKKGRRRKLAKDRRVEAVGIALIAFGCLVTALVWTGIRDSNNVAFQLPIIASGGLVAVGCFIVGGLLVVGGLVMTRFARLESARAGGATQPAPAAAETPAPAGGATQPAPAPAETPAPAGGATQPAPAAEAGSDGSDHEVSLAEGPGEHRPAVRARRQGADATPELSENLTEG